MTTLKPDFCHLAGWPSRALMVIFVLIACSAEMLSAQTPTSIDELHIAADIDSGLPRPGGGTTYSNDAAIAILNLGLATATSNNPIGLLDQAGIDGYHRGGDGCTDSIYSLDTTTSIAGITMRPADVFTGTGVKVLDADAAGIPTGINVDALSRDPVTCDLLLSIDTAATIGGTAFGRDQILRWNSIDGFSLYQATRFGVNVDALHYLSPNRMLVSIDVGAALPDIDGLDHEVLEIDAGGGVFQLIAFDPALSDGSWQAADLNAIWALPTPVAGTVQWQDTMIDVLESSGGTFLVISRINGSEVATDLTITTANGTATAGIDYTAAGGIVSMVAGQTSLLFGININNDALVEGTEFFTITIDSASNGTTVGSPMQIQVNIIDDEDFIFADGFE